MLQELSRRLSNPRLLIATETAVTILPLEQVDLRFVGLREGMKLAPNTAEHLRTEITLTQVQFVLFDPHILAKRLNVRCPGEKLLLSVQLEHT